MGFQEGCLHALGHILGNTALWRSAEFPVTLQIMCFLKSLGEICCACQVAMASETIQQHLLDFYLRLVNHTEHIENPRVHCLLYHILSDKSEEQTSRMQGDRVRQARAAG